VAIEETRGQVVVNELMTIDADAHQMGQLFQNLISNALKFHKPDESPIVTIEAARIDRELCEIRVQDNGIGFDEKYLDRVFGIFERLHGRHSEYPGTGIGLAICQKIVDRHHGNITAISQPGLGATFIITLPVRQCESAPLPA
jgi:signal transduction histidine kinase